MIKDYRNIHEGAEIFILGSGPSLHFFDQSILDGKIVICVNSSILKRKNPSYYLTSDGSQVLKHHWQYVQKGNFPVIAGSQGAGAFILKYGPIQKGRLCSFQKEKVLKMNPDAEALIFGSSSVHCAVHFAVILGASKIIVVGADCGRAKTGEAVFYDYKDEEKDFHKVPDNVPQKISIDSVGNEMLSYWNKLRDENKNISIQAYGGKLEAVFPKYEA